MHLFHEGQILNSLGDVREQADLRLVPDSQFAFAVFTYDSRTLGNVATEVAKYYLQLHFGIKQDYRLPVLLERTNFYQGRT